MDCKKAVVKNADMPDEMQQFAVDTAAHAMTEYNIEKDIACYVKKEFDKVYGPTWHCIVGRNFGRFIVIFIYRFSEEIFDYRGDLKLAIDN
ncbi:hypothetical protein MN116_008868 [Schistosoma mekongi]|uniref:Dynein light chain n=1 Tax=Schistosoma mekongi TaxID=38744 RepID=A0AAE2D104_SCHME|nr:hypothetical protein MN116_008868 [Schistosoma mekongi]